MYFNELLPLVAKTGDDGNYAATVDSDLACLQVKQVTLPSMLMIPSKHIAR